jgi:hypothetical protein
MASALMRRLIEKLTPKRGHGREDNLESHHQTATSSDVEETGLKVIYEGTSCRVEYESLSLIIFYKTDNLNV